MSGLGNASVVAGWARKRRGAWLAELAGLEPETMSATEIREAYLGSLSLPNEAEQPALEIAAAAATSAS